MITADKKSTFTKTKNKDAFTLFEFIFTLLLVSFVFLTLAEGIPLLKNTVGKENDKSEATIMMSTAIYILKTDLRDAVPFYTEDGSSFYFKTANDELLEYDNKDNELSLYRVIRKDNALESEFERKIIESGSSSYIHLENINPKHLTKDGYVEIILSVKKRDNDEYIKISDRDKIKICIHMANKGHEILK